MPKLVAREGNDLETIPGVLIVDLSQLFVAPIGHPSPVGNVHHKDGFFSLAELTHINFLSVYGFSFYIEEIIDGRCLFGNNISSGVALSMSWLRKWTLMNLFLLERSSRENHGRRNCSSKNQNVFFHYN